MNLKSTCRSAALPDDRIIRKLQRFQLGEFLGKCREHGRGQVPRELREHAKNLFNWIDDLQSAKLEITSELRKAVSLAHDFLWSEQFLATNEAPRYLAYTNLKVVNSFLLTGKQVSLSKSLERTKYAMTILIRDWLEYEKNAIIRFPDRYDGLSFSIKHVRERVSLLEDFCLRIFIRSTPAVPPIGQLPNHPYKTDWIFYAIEFDGALGLSHLTGLPQSKYHDEYMFLRTIHIAECCYHGLILTIKATLLAYTTREYGDAAEILNEANFFASSLVRLFSIFDTMPVESFYDGFRVATGDASAIQSERYQLLEKISRGINRDKTDVLRKQREVSFIADLYPTYALHNVLQELEKSGEEKNIHSLITELFQLLAMWRSKHLGIARKYLPPDTKGTGEAGVSCLENNVRNPRNSSIASLVCHPTQSRIRLTSAFRAVAPNIDIYWCQASNLLGAKVMEYLRSSETLVCSSIIDAIGNIQIQNAVELYDRTFAEKQHCSPLTAQFLQAQKTGIAKTNPVSTIRLAVEIQAGVLIELFDLTKIKGDLRFDIAVEGDSYEHFSGKIQRCHQGDWIIRDSKGIVASYFDGPAKRTALDAEKLERGEMFSEIGVIVLGAPGLPKSCLDAGKLLIEKFITGFSEKVSWWTLDL